MGTAGTELCRYRPGKAARHVPDRATGNDAGRGAVRQDREASRARRQATQVGTDQRREAIVCPLSHPRNRIGAHSV